VGFSDGHDKKGDAVFVLFVEFVKGGSLPPKGRSSITAEHQYHGLLAV
jgi:hypothetical protein